MFIPIQVSISDKNYILPQLVDYLIYQFIQQLVPYTLWDMKIYFYALIFPFEASSIPYRIYLSLFSYHPLEIGQFLYIFIFKNSFCISLILIKNLPILFLYSAIERNGSIFRISLRKSHQK